MAKIIITIEDEEMQGIAGSVSGYDTTRIKFESDGAIPSNPEHMTLAQFQGCLAMQHLMRESDSVEQIVSSILN